ncbi:5-azacytidine-induced protein 2 isoform X2 [Hyla sarda]|uniref:5-azacytidine-induced protein 2 isoform X2 n=1 Tax=Hyla sarda TaxID=327740 RepID=UPI0024C26277|nr:5-azacytidine-induced protein 2 isoform X2 [Hyla sarda]
MDSFIDDDICILTREKDSTKRERAAPMSISGDSSVASHFALVTAYEDIKKRLKDTERENYSLKKRLRQMEDKLCGESSMVESEKVNKAFGAFREISIERDNLIKKLSAVEKEKIEFTRNLNEQLQSKEVELLQMKSELETHQVMKSLSKSITDWEIEKLNSELKIRSVEQELKLLQEECGRLRAELERTKNATADKSLCQENYQDDVGDSESSMRQAYWELKKEMSNLHLVTEVQAEVLRKLKGTVAATKKASRGPVQCEEDLERTLSNIRITAGGVTYQKAVSPKEQKLNGGASAPQPHSSTLNTLSVKPEGAQWTVERPIPVGGIDCEETDSYQKSYSEENSWVIPSPPKPSETLFWETKNNSASSNPGQYYSPNYNFDS